MVDDAPRILGGRYEVGELIGRGGMAEVHIGHDTRLGRTVAIKILRSDLARDPSFQARFRREAQAAASLNHPAIVAVYDTGEDVFTERGGGIAHVPFIVMEYVEGHTVRDILRDGAAVPIEEAVEITAGVLSALEYSHHAGIVHRDIKPANVMLTPTGAVKVMDFGIARAMADAAGTMTQTQAVIGTAQYLSPEQARGEAVDSRSDLYSTGCLLFELLTGRPPFVGDSPVAVAYQHAREEAQPPSAFASDVPDELDRITMKALAKDRDARYSSAAEFRSDLEAALRGGHVSAPALGALGAGALGAGATVPFGADPTGQLTQPTQVMRPGVPAGGPATGATQVVPAGAPWGQTGAARPAGPPPSTHGLPNADDHGPEPRRRWVMWTLIAVGLAALAGIVWLLVNDDSVQVVQVEVPDVVGEEQAAAQEIIEDADLAFRAVPEASDEVPAGQVIRTDPEAGAEAEAGDTVTAFVSQGPDAVTVPEVSNLTQQQAIDELVEAGFARENISVDTEDHPTIERDRAVRTDPAVDTSVAPDQPITLYLSTGLVALPDLTGADQAIAEQTLRDLGLVPRVTTEESADVAPGTVIRQSRTPGPVEQRSEIEIVVATAPVVEQITLPDLSGRTWAEAEQRLRDLGLVPERRDASPEESGDRPRDEVVRTEPGPGQTVEEGATVVVLVSRGPGEGGGDGGGGGGEGD